ncbi:MAG: hypothetical protein HY910_17550 [Desulfarculus sp.]|nr:hypothetical protein [Desulfarculus sp.]
MAGLRVIVFDGGPGLCLYLRLPGGQRLLVDCAARAGAEALSLLRGLGEVGPLSPLTRHLRLGSQTSAADWLGVLGLLRGLVLRPGGSWVFWQAAPPREAGFGLTARVIPRCGLPHPPQPDMFEPAVLVLGLTPHEVLALGGGPADWLAAASLALHWPRLPGGDGELLVGGDLPEAAWESLLNDGVLCRLLGGVSCYAGGLDQAGGQPEDGASLDQGLIAAALPWLLLGAFSGEGVSFLACPGRGMLRTPAIGMLTIDADERGVITVEARPRAANRVAWSGLARPLDDAALPAPAALRRALGSRSFTGERRHV